MTGCEVCGNGGDRLFEVETGDGIHAFDSYECAIYGLTVTCRRCGCRVVGRGLEAAGGGACCPACARVG